MSDVLMWVFDQHVLDYHKDLDKIIYEEMDEDTVRCVECDSKITSIEY